MTKSQDSTGLSFAYDPEQDPVYMSAAMRTYFRNKLEALKEEILTKEESISLSLVNAPNQQADSLDQSTQEGINYTAFMFQEHEDHLRTEIESALQRIEAGTYGYCEATEKPIGIKRLLLVPMAQERL